VAGVGGAFALRYSPAIRWLLSPIGLGPAHSGADVYHGFVRIRMGWAFHADVGRTSITGARLFPGTVRWTAGAHTNLRGRWLVNGAGSGLVELTMDPPSEGWSGGFPIHVRSLLIGLEDPDGFLRALADRAPTGNPQSSARGDGYDGTAAP
jgi:hypothetical protein